MLKWYCMTYWFLGTSYKYMGAYLVSMVMWCCVAHLEHFASVHVLTEALCFVLAHSVRCLRKGFRISWTGSDSQILSNTASDLYSGLQSAASL